jgi:hypothetical protein
VGDLSLMAHCHEAFLWYIIIQRGGKMSFNQHDVRSNSNEFDLAKETFRLIMGKMGDYEKLVELQNAVADNSYDTRRAVDGLQTVIHKIGEQLDTLRTQQAQIILEAILIRKDLDILLDLFGDVATYSKDVSAKRSIHGDAG